MLDLVIDPSVRGLVSDPMRGRLQRRLARMVKAASLHEAREIELEVSARLTDDVAMRALNRDYRGKDKSTDVLAFAMREGPVTGMNDHVLGDLVISVPSAKRQAKRGLLRELVFLGAHGLCHLLGYDHQNDDDERVMNKRMRALIREADHRGPTGAA